MRTQPRAKTTGLQGVSNPKRFPFHSCSSPFIPVGSLSQANDDDGTKYLCSKAQLIDELEASLPGWVRRPAWYPQFVHLLKVRPGFRVKELCRGGCGGRPGTLMSCTC